MRILHRAMMTVMLAAVLVVGVGAMQPWSLTAEAQHGAAQHGQADDPEDHFNVVAERLELTADQRETLAGTFHEAFAAMQELHRLHDVIAAELTDGQKGKLTAMIHEALGGSVSQQSHGRSDHGWGHP